MTAQEHKLRFHRLLLEYYSYNPMRFTPSTLNTTPLQNRDDPELDRAMIILLAALLTSLLFFLAIGSLVRCILRRFNSPEKAKAEAALDALKQIPVVVYDSAANVDFMQGKECAICLGEFKDGERLRLLPNCRHCFHLMCVDVWLVDHSSCPTCRQPLIGCG